MKIKTVPMLTLWGAMVFGLGPASAEAAETVTIESLLTEMIDRDSVARFPEPDFRLRQHSSYNRASKTPDEPKGWFNNQDFGILRFSVNGKAAGSDVDLYSEKPMPSGPIPVGVFEPQEDAYVIRMEVVGKQGQSSGTFFGIDCIAVLGAE